MEAKSQAIDFFYMLNQTNSLRGQTARVDLHAPKRLIIQFHTTKIIIIQIYTSSK